MKKLIGIIIPVRNLSWMTINLLDSIKYCNGVSDFKFYIIDNGSEKEDSKSLTDYLEKYIDNYEYLYSEKPLGFVKAVNRGMKKVLADKLDYFFIMNNDTIVTKDWYKKMITSLKGRDVAIVGPVTSPPDWKNLPMAKSMIKNKTKYMQVAQSLETFNEQLESNFQGVEQEVDFLAFYCVALKVSVVKQLGLLDEIFNLGLFDDDDYCNRILEAGYRLILRKDTYVHHYHNSTFTANNLDYMKMLAENKQIFIDKWGFDPWEMRQKRYVERRA